MVHLYTFGAFCALQVVFHYAHEWWHGHEDRLRAARMGTALVVVTHPLAISAAHDWAIYLVGEMHTIVTGR